MAAPWKPSIKRAAKLSVYFHATTRNPVWSTVLGTVLKEFNVLAERHDIKLRLGPSDQIPTATSGAEVMIQIVSGSVAMNFCGQDVTETINPIAMEGVTRPVDGDNGTIKAIILLPSTPKILTPKALRVVGPKVLMLMALHELLHAAGLEDSDHAVLGVFQTNPEIDHNSDAAHDKVRLQRGAMAWMPPFLLAPDSAEKMNLLWPRT